MLGVLCVVLSVIRLVWLFYFYLWGRFGCRGIRGGWYSGWRGGGCLMCIVLSRWVEGGRGIRRGGSVF